MQYHYYTIRHKQIYIQLPREALSQILFDNNKLNFALLIITKFTDKQHLIFGLN